MILLVLWLPIQQIDMNQLYVQIDLCLVNSERKFD